MIAAEHLSVAIGCTPILSDVTFHAAPGQVTAIVGPNGSGKSTLLDALSGSLPHDGRVTLDGTGIAQMPAHRLAARRAVLPQSQTLAFAFTVMEVVRMGLGVGRRAAGVIRGVRSGFDWP